LRSALLFPILIWWSAAAGFLPAQEPGHAAETSHKQAEQKPSENERPKKAEKPQLPFQIQLLETKVHFDANGDSRKEVHTVVRIINVLGVQQFGRLSFDYNRKYQQIEIPMVRVSHKNGGTSEILPSAITDSPNPATEHFPSYQDIRVKAVRVLGLQDGDTIEYKVITTTTKPPLAPDFWLEHSFDRSGQVLEEHYELEVPSARKIEMHINPATPVATKETKGTGESAALVYLWRRTYSPAEDTNAPDVPVTPDVSFSTFTWDRLSARLAELLLPGSVPLQQLQARDDIEKEMARRPEADPAVRERAIALTQDAKTDAARLKAIYKFVSSQINTVDVPLGSTGFRARTAAEVLSSGYATGEDKYVLLAALAASSGLRADAVLTGYCDRKAAAIPTEFKHLVAIGSTKDHQFWLDPAIEVAPFGIIAPSDATCGFALRRDAATPTAAGLEWVELPTGAPFAAFQRVSVDAAIAKDGSLTAKVKYELRGENELLLRVAFHQAPTEKWKDVASMLAISDGFRGQVTNAQVSDPTSTDDPFTVEYELTQLKFVDWSKKPVRIPALLPQISLPDLPLPQNAGSSAAPPIVLGVPLDVQTAMTLKIPEGTTVQTPAGTSVARDFATYSSKYSSSGDTIVASRSINFLKREIPGDRATEYNAFLHAVLSDQGQRFVLVENGK